MPLTKNGTATYVFHNKKCFSLLYFTLCPLHFVVTFHCFNSDIYGEKQNPHSLSRTSIQTRQEDIHFFFNQLYPFTYTEHKLRQLSRNTILIINDLQIAICKKLILYILVDYTVDSISRKAIFSPTVDVSDRFLDIQRRTHRENRVCTSKRFFILFFFKD